MVPEKQFYTLAEEVLGVNDAFVSSPVPGYTGVLVCIDNECAIVDDELDSLTRLPKYILNDDAARSYIQSLNRAFREGEKSGIESLKKQLAGLLGFATKDYVDYLDERTNSRIKQ